MEIRQNSFALRGESGLVKIVSDSVFDPASGARMYSEVSPCDVIVESNGFRVNKTVSLSMPRILHFLQDLEEALSKGLGEAVLRSGDDELVLIFRNTPSEHLVLCTMNDRREGKENCVSVKYGIEPDYYENLRRELAGVKIAALQLNAGPSGALTAAFPAS